MVKKLKQIYRTAGVMILALGLAACGSSAPETGGTQTGNQTGTTPSTKPTEEVKKAEELEHVTLTLYFPGGSDGQVDEAMVEEEISKYLADKINASVDLVQLDWGTWEQLPNLMISSGEVFDMLFTASWNGFGSNVARGAFLPLDDLIEQYGQGLKKELPEALLEGAKVNGQIYAIPTNKEIAAQFGLIFDKELLEKYNFELGSIQKIEDIEPWLAIIKENEPNIIPFYSNGTRSPYAATLDYESVGDNDVPGAYVNGQVVNQYILQESIGMYDLAYKWMQAGYINQDAIQHPTYENYFCTSEQLKPGKDAELSQSKSRELVQLEMTAPQIRTGNIQGSMLAISRTSKNPERAMMLLDLMNTDAYLNNLMNWGIEGVHYTKVADNIISRTEQTDNYSLGANWMFQNQFLNYLWDNEDPNKWDAFRTFNEEAEASPLLGLVFDPTPVAEEVAAVKNAMEQYREAFRTGVLKFDDYKDRYIKELEDAGLNKVLQEKQAQVDKFLSAK